MWQQHPHLTHPTLTSHTLLTHPPHTLPQVVGLNFSSATTPELLLKTFDHYCEYRRTPNGVVMAPIQLGKWVRKYKAHTRTHT